MFFYHGIQCEIFPDETTCLVFAIIVNGCVNSQCVLTDLLSIKHQHDIKMPWHSIKLSIGVLYILNIFN